MATSEMSTQRSDPISSSRLATRDGIWYRLGAASGLVFVVLFIATIAVTRFPNDTSDAGIRNFFADPAVQRAELAHFYLILAAAVFLLWFISTMRTAQPTPSTGHEAIVQFALVCGLLYAAFLLVTNMLEVGLFSAGQDSNFRLDANTDRAIEGVAYLGFITSNVVGGVWVAAASSLMVRTRTFPTWLGWIGVLTGAGMVVAWLLGPISLGVIFVLLIWIATTSVLMIRRAPQGTAL